MSAPTVIVTGDVVLDCHLYGGIKTEATSHREPGTAHKTHLGGASLSFKLMTAAAAASGTGLKPCLGLAKKGLRKRLLRCLRSYGVWTPHDARKDAKDDAPKVWRVKTNFGYGSGSVQSGQGRQVFVKAAKLPRKPSLIVVDDGGILFRHDSARKAWPDFSTACGAEPGLPVIILKMGAPICRGALWQKLHSEPGIAEKLMVIVSAADLRSEDAQIRQHLSWEQCAADALRALHHHPLASELLKAAHVIVNFRSSGALWLHRDAPGGKHTAELIFDPVRLEGEYGRGFEGSVYGFQSCLAAAVAHHCVMSSVAKTSLLDAIAAGITSGLCARRKLMELGHGQVGKGEPGFPIAEIGQVIAAQNGGYARVGVPVLQPEPGGCQWSILASSEDTPAASGAAGDAPHLGLALWTARYGRDALSRAPTLTVDKLFTADRSEIESFRTLERLIRGYEEGKSAEKPLSIGVFGPPGAGKSFGVKALARAILGKEVPILEFNLSQFKEPGELIGAFHRVRDEALKGRTPVAFWDEFDSQGNQWLQYLLAPMQDGAFQDGQLTHPIGKCVFIFAGGTASSIEEFEDKKTDEERMRFKLLKGPDFISRLHGFLNVLGPNPRKDASAACPDRTWPIRRALMLRGILGLKDKPGASDVLDMDPGLLIALLAVPHYTHGSRSFEKILLTLKQGRSGRRFHRSALPPDSLLSRETNLQAFQDIMTQHDAFKTNPDIEAIAAAIHRDYLKNAKTNGWTVAAEVNKPYAELSPDYQTANRGAAQRIPELLALISFRIVKASGSEDTSWQQPLIEQIDRHHDRLSEAEHLGWNAERIANGWTYAPVRDNARKQHNLIVPWAKLSEKDKDKDRENMKAIPNWLRDAGYKAERVK